MLTSATVLVGQLLASWTLAAPALAASSEDKPLNLDAATPTETIGGGGGSGGSILRTLFGLAIVVGVIFALYWILRKIKGGPTARAGGSGLQTVATLPLGEGRALHLVRVGNDLVLVGASEHGVTSLRSYDEQEARALGLLAEPASRARILGGEAAERSWTARALGGDTGPDRQPAARVHGADPAEQSPTARVLDAVRRMTVRR